MYSVNVGFKTSKGTIDETQVDVSSTVDLVNIILGLQKEMDIREIAYLEEPLVELEVTD